MAGLGHILRLRKWELDLAQRELRVLTGRAQELADRMRELEAEHEAERKSAATGVAAFQNYAGYALAWSKRREALQAAIDDALARVAGQREIVAGAFNELKKLEITNQQRAERTELERRAREQAELDAIGIDRHRRASR